MMKSECWRELIRVMKRGGKKQGKERWAACETHKEQEVQLCEVYIINPTGSFISISLPSIPKSSQSQLLQGKPWSLAHYI